MRAIIGCVGFSVLSISIAEVELYRRKAVARLVNGKRVFHYLVQWFEWPMWDCTWSVYIPSLRISRVLKRRIREPAKHIPNLEYWEDHFLDAAKKAGVESKFRIALLPDAEEWFDEQGYLREDRLREKGIEPRSWSERRATPARSEGEHE